MASPIVILENLVKLYKSLKGFEPEGITPMVQSGSNRRYYRLTGNGNSLIGTYNPNTDENRTFVYLSNHFAHKGFRVPQVLAVSPDETYYLQSDLGNRSLFDLISQVRNWSDPESAPVRKLLFETINELVKFQTTGLVGLTTDKLFSYQSFDKRSVFWDLNYFKYSFLKPAAIEFNENILEDEFETLAGKLFQAQSDFFMYRDFQSRNVMIVDDKPYFIDFQGGRTGPALYDIASFIYQARANFSRELRLEMFQHYLEQLAHKSEIEVYRYVSLMPYFALFRTLQVLGAYGYRGFFERKNHFISSIPFAVTNLAELTRQTENELPHLSSVATQLSEKYGNAVSTSEPYECLTLQITSFSFKKGYPADHPDHGGGFVFDCRGLPNPGRLPEFANLTGLDRKTANYLAKHRDVEKFFDTTLSLVRSTVETYKARGFNHLSIAFGCTGGQHRSVYMASRMAELFATLDGIRVTVKHRELEE